MNNNTIGVLGSLKPERSVMDKRLQAEFNRTHESYTLTRNNSAIGVLGSVNPNQLSVMDKMMQREYNPYWNSQENYSEQRSVKDRMMDQMYNPQVNEGYCNRNNNFSGYQNPYNPLTPLIQNARLV